MRIAALLFLLLAAPALAQPRPAGRAAELDALFAGLKLAPSEATAERVEARIRELWAQATAPTALLLIRRAGRELAADAAEEALDDADAALVLDPATPVGLQCQAEARYATGDYAGALADLRAALQREPRFFPAFETLSRIAEDHDDAKGALAAWQKRLEISPKTPDGEERLKTLTRKAMGDAT